MAAFMATIRFTERGLKSIRETTRRAAAFKSAAKTTGVKVTGVYWCLGAFDGLLLFEAADARTAAAAMIDLASLGNVSTQTIQLFTASEMEKILAVTPQAGP